MFKIKNKSSTKLGIICILSLLVTLFALFLVPKASAATQTIDKTFGITITIPTYAPNDTLEITGAALTADDWTVLRNNTTLDFHLYLNNPAMTAIDAASLLNPIMKGNTHMLSLEAPYILSIASSVTSNIGAFYDCVALTSVNLPAATSIGEEAFGYCTALTSVNLPAATSIDDGAFYDCVALTSVNLPAATSIGEKAFGYCTALTSVNLPAATSIGSWAFDDCAALTSVHLPAVTDINYGAFEGCQALTSVNLPAVTYIDNWAFENCLVLTEFTFGDTPPAVGTDVVFGGAATVTYYHDGNPISNISAWNTFEASGGLGSAHASITLHDYSSNVYILSAINPASADMMLGSSQQFSSGLTLSVGTAPLPNPQWVYWTLTGPSPLHSTVDASGLVTIHPDETNTTLLLTATYAIGTKTGSQTANINVISTACEIISFTIPNQVGTSAINSAAGTISVVMPFGTNVTALAPTIGVSAHATVSHTIGTTVDFTIPVDFVVTAQDSLTTQTYTVSVTLAPSTACEIISFTIPNQVGTSAINSAAGTIAVVMPFGTNVTALAPTIGVSAHATVSHTIGTTIDFTIPVDFVVTAQDSLTTQTYTVSVTLAPSTACEIISFTIPNQVGTSAINSAAGTISVVMPFGTNVTALAPTIGVSAHATVSHTIGTTIDFTIPVDFVVTAQDISTTQTYTVSVTLAPSTACEIISFTIPNQVGTSAINSAAGTISVVMPFGTNVTALAPTIGVSAHATVSHTIGTTVDFTIPVDFVVTAQDSLTTQTYTVSVTLAPSTACEIISFTIPNQVGTSAINSAAGTIAVVMPFGTNVTALAPTIGVSAHATVSHTIGTTVDFTIPVDFVVTAQDSLTTQTYTVSVTLAPSTACEIISFTIPNQVGTSAINSAAGTIAVVMPFGTNVTALAPTIGVSAHATVSHTIGTTVDFTIPVDFVVTAQDSLTTQTYTVSVTLAPSTACEIISFTIPNQVGTSAINSAAGTIAVVMPFGTNVTALAPTIGVSAHATVSHTIGTTVDFTIPVDFVVTAQDSLTTQTYTVSVTLAPSTACEIISFTIPNQVGTSAINSAAGTIAVVMPFGTNVTALAPTIGVSAHATVSHTIGTTVDFTIPVDFVVTAQDISTTQTYTVSVTLAPSTACDIISFTIPNQVGTSAINSAAGTISVVMPFGTNVTALAPTIGVSAHATVSHTIGTTVDFTIPVDFVVTAQDSLTTQTYTVSVTLAPSTACDIISFTIPNQVGTSAINSAAGTISVVMPFGTNVTALAPTIGVSAHATVSHTIGTTVDFTIPVDFVVTAQDSLTTQTYTVSVTLAAAPPLTPTPDPVSRPSVPSSTVSSYSFSQLPSVENNFTAIVNGDFSKFTGVSVDGSIVGSDNYRAWSGSTYVQLNSSYVNSLSVGEHTLSIHFTDGSATSSFSTKGTSGGILGVLVYPFGESLQPYTPSATPSANAILSESIDEGVMAHEIFDSEESFASGNNGLATIAISLAILGAGYVIINRRKTR